LHPSPLKDKFEAYNQAAKEIGDEVLCSGRRHSQESYIPTIVKDITLKLELDKADFLLDIGCGTGLITSQLFQNINTIYALDNENMIKKFKELHPKEANKIIFFKGNFLEVNLQLKVDKILCYSVIHYLKDKEEITAFIDKALTLLKSGGMILLGDLPNVSHKNRFLKTEFGKNFSEAFRAKETCGANTDESTKFDRIFSESKDSFSDFDDDFLIELIATYRRKGFPSYILPQNGERNAFGYTREDILIKKYR
jgi:2-polyprenyl-3-methyl-5-hydroxy-6-metoxy-1,4-benzoquinol methylase